MIVTADLPLTGSLKVECGGSQLPWHLRSEEDTKMKRFIYTAEAEFTLHENKREIDVRPKPS